MFVLNQVTIIIFRLIDNNNNNILDVVHQYSIIIPYKVYNKMNHSNLERLKKKL